MVSEEKIRLMTRIAMDEAVDLKDEIEDGAKFRLEYVLSHTLKIFSGVTVSYLLILCLVALYHIEYLVANAIHLEYRRILLFCLGIYLGVALLTILFSSVYFTLHYPKMRRKVKKYLADLELLQDYYDKDKEGGAV